MSVGFPSCHTYCHNKTILFIFTNPVYFLKTKKNRSSKIRLKSMVVDNKNVVCGSVRGSLKEL